MTTGKDNELCGLKLFGHPIEEINAKKLEDSVAGVLDESAKRIAKDSPIQDLLKRFERRGA